MKNDIINKNDTGILKTLCRNFVRPTGMRYNHCVSLSVRPICLPNIPPSTGY